MSSNFIESVEIQTVTIAPNKNLQTINLAEVAQTLEKIKIETQEQTEDKLYVFDINGNKVLL